MAGKRNKTAGQALGMGVKEAPPEAAARQGQTGPIGAEQMNTAEMVLKEYKEDKSSLNARIVDNEQWWKLRHWEDIRRGAKDAGESPEPASAWLFNSITNNNCLIICFK